MSREDEIMMITSGGDNVLDALIHGPNRVYTIDMNKHQNYLLELKLGH